MRGFEYFLLPPFSMDTDFNLVQFGAPPAFPHGGEPPLIVDLTVEQLDALKQFDTCTLANAIERFGVRLRNQGYTRPGLRCFTSEFPKILGFAAPCRVRVADPPVIGGAFFERVDWWSAIQKVPAPRIAVIQDLDPEPVGSSIGEVHAAILQAFHCCGAITNGAVRDIPTVARMGFQMFACHAAVSHSYAHVVDFGTEVEILGLQIRYGDLLMADCHGVLSIPNSIVAELPAVAEVVRARRQRIVDVCRSPGFSVEKLQQTIQQDQE
jgi:regulator of RNase E activity RraA